MLSLSAKRDFSIRIPVILVTVMVFFGHLIPFINYYQMLFLILMTTFLLVLMNKGKISIYNNMIWLLCIIILMISLIFSYDKLSTLKFTLMFVSILIIKFLFEGQKNWQSFFVKCLFYASLFHVTLTLFQFIFPSIITDINSVILSNLDFNTNLELMSNGSYAGITGQTGINAFFISILIAITYSKLINNSQKKVLLITILSLGMIALFLTVKRSQIIINAVAMLSLLFLFRKKDIKSKINLILIPILMVCIGYIILTSIPTTNNVIKKFILFADSSDFTNGRVKLWSETIEVFNMNPVFGIGAGAIDSQIGEKTHNIYIQILGEMGILGIFVFAFAFLFSLVKTVRLIRSYLTKDYIKNEHKYLLALGLYMQIYFILYGLSGNPLYSPIFLTIYMLMISIVNSVHLSNKYLITRRK